MEQKNKLPAQIFQGHSWLTPVLLGAGIALIVISFFVFGVGKPKPEWGELWMIRPLIITPVAGAFGGAFYYFINHLGHKIGLNKALAVMLGVVIYIIALWLGIILGLDGTLWN
jgi:hypothetical protein